MAGQILVQFRELLAVPFFRMLQMGNRGLDDDSPRLLLFAVWPGGSREAHRPDQRRQGQTLQYERDKNNAESEEDDQVAMRERASIRQNRGERQGGRQ